MLDLDRPAPAILAVAAVTVLAALRYAGVGLHAGDVVYLLPLEGITTGGEAPRPLRHLSWGLLHTLGHLWTPPGWARGHVGWPVSLAAAGLVPWTAWVTARLARALELPRTAVHLAAVFAALAPAALLNAGTIDTIGRWLASGCGLLALAVALELRSAASWRPVWIAGVLQALAIAWHPAAVTAPLVLGVALLLVVPRAAWPRALSAVGLGVLAAGLWILASRQAAIAAVGASSLLDAAWFQPLLASLMTGWQLPAVGWLAPRLPVALLGLAIPALAVFLALRPSTRPLGAVLAASLVAMLADGASVGFLAEPVIAWTVGTTQSAMTAAVVASLLAARALVGRPRWLLGGVIALALIRGVLLMDARRVDADGDARIQRVLAVQLLAPAAARDDVRPWIVGSAQTLMEPLKNAKWNPELPAQRRRPPGQRDLSTRVVGAVQSAPDGIDGAVWQAAVHRCELWLGLERDRQGPCSEHPRVVDEPPGGWSCALDVRATPWHPRCPPRPDVLSAEASRDPRGLPWAAVSLLVLATAVGLSYGSRRSNT